LASLKAGETHRRSQSAERFEQVAELIRRFKMSKLLRLTVCCLAPILACALVLHFLNLPVTPGPLLLCLAISLWYEYRHSYREQ
jgi:hypothetical protein